MENLLSRHRNVTILVAVLFAEVVGLGIQVKHSTDTQATAIMREWVLAAVTPIEKAFVHVQQAAGETWSNYFYLRGVRAQNRALQDEIERLRLEQVRLNEDASQARRLQVLLGFKEQFISKTMPAQVIGSSGSELSRVVYIDKGVKDGVEPDMAVITAEGIVGKVLRVFTSTSQVLLINDPSSGVGAVLEKSRLQGVLKGSPSGETVVENVMLDERVEPGEKILTSGGDRIFPKGLPIGTVSKVSPGPDFFLSIRVKPAASLSRLEEVLVITKVDERQPAAEAASAPVRASDMLASRLPSVPPKPPAEKAKPAVANVPGQPPANKTAGISPMGQAGNGVKPRPKVMPAKAASPNGTGAGTGPGATPTAPPESKPEPNASAPSNTAAEPNPKPATPAEKPPLVITDSPEQQPAPENPQ